MLKVHTIHVWGSVGVGECTCAALNFVAALALDSAAFVIYQYRHGFAGYFESVLYKDVIISIVIDFAGRNYSMLLLIVQCAFEHQSTLRKYYDDHFKIDRFVCPYVSFSSYGKQLSSIYRS